MLDISQVRNAFPNLLDVTALNNESGQRDVCKAILNQQNVALKIFKKSPRAEERLSREVTAISKLGSPYVPKIVDHGKRTIQGEERLYIIEEWIEGKTYADVLRENPIQSLSNVLTLGKFLIEACCDFESKNLVHRDIKPNNLLIDLNRRLWVLDFGIVRHLDLISLTGSENRFGLGTFGYGAPEQMRNIKVTINSRADLFSIGVVLYESLSGSNPYLVGKGNNILAILQHMESRDIPRLSIKGDHNNELSEFIAAITARFPSRRPQSAKEAKYWFLPIFERLHTGDERSDS